MTFIYLVWPYLALFSLYINLRIGNVDELENRVDWYSLNKNLEVDLNSLVAIKLREGLNKKEILFSFDSMTLSKQISKKVATPEGLIYLYNEPDEFIEQIRQIFINNLSPEKIKPPVTEKKIFEPEGPNFPDLFKRIQYVFFTSIKKFRLSLNHGDLSFTINWQLQGLTWKLINIKIPIEKI